ncbi:MAG: sigma-70 family RNA polymerase sigma factor, partial [Clostridia bacterium]|nr:sigma-70 family RNA polymerase sigma factor [Clostridia bacterium]
AALALESMSPLVSLSDSAFGEEEGVELGAILPDEESSSEIERLCDRIALGQAVSRMPQQWQKIVMLRFYRNQTQQQTADALGITQVKVSREEKKILDFLRGEMLR